ncbi:hypothetical protein V6N13_089388 [Hibiscus sabdariffa]
MQDVLCQYRCKMMLIQKTKLEVSSFLVRKIWYLDSFDFAFHHHTVIMVDYWGSRLFRFLNCLLEKRAYVRTMELEWSCISHEIVVVNVIDQLRLMKQLLRVWNKDVFGSVDERIEATWMLCKECNHK